jgi:hypothetical protein
MESVGDNSNLNPRSRFECGQIKMEKNENSL